ncbi:MAG: hypothetical protein ACRDUW_23285 [Pseudonocardiaceae bacterium]
MLNFLNFIPGWASHGTKIIGVVTTALGAVLTLNPAQLSAFHVSASGVATVAGILTVLRGFDNKPPTVNPPPPAK